MASQLSPEAAQKRVADRKAFLSKINRVHQAEYDDDGDTKSGKPAMHVEGIHNDIPNIDSNDFSGDGLNDKSSSSLFCFCFPCANFCSVSGLLKLPFLPCLWILQLILPITLAQNALAYVNMKVQGFKDQMLCVFQTAYQPVKFGKFGLRCIFNLALIVTAILSAFSLAFVQYGTFYYLQIPKTELVQELQFTPLSIASSAGKQVQPALTQQDTLTSTVLFQPDMDLGNLSADIKKREPAYMEEMSDIDLSKEQYGVALDLEVAETVHNMEQGNLYLTAQLVPCDQNKVSRVYKRMGHYDYKGRLNLYMKELARITPFAQRLLWLYSREALLDSQLINIPITQDLNNKESPLCRIELQLSNKYLQFKRAQLRFYSILSPYSLTTGYRYYMREWFWTCILLCTGSLTVFNFLSIFFCLFIFGCLPCIARKSKSG